MYQLTHVGKSPLIHLKDTEVEQIAAATPRTKMDMTGRAPDLIHPLSGPRWIFVAEDVGSFQPALCSKVLPVYITGEGCSFHQKPPFVTGRVWPAKSAADAISPPVRFRPPPSSTYGDHFGPLGLQDLASVAVPTTAGQRCLAREDVSIVSQHFDPRAASHFSPVIKALRRTRSRQYPWAEYWLKELSFRSWVWAAKQKMSTVEAEEDRVEEEPEASKEGNAPQSDQPATEVPALVPADETDPEPRQYPPDVGGNAEAFQPKDLRQGLVTLKILWSQAWKAAGSAAAFESLLSALSPPALSPARALRSSLRRGAQFDCTLSSPAWAELDRQAVAEDATLPRSSLPKMAQPPKKAAEPWHTTLRPGIHDDSSVHHRLPWSQDFVSLPPSPLENDVIKLDLVLRTEFHRCNYFLKRQAATRQWGEELAARLHRSRPWCDECKGPVWEPLPAKVIRLDLPTRRQVIVSERRAAKRKTWQQLFDIRAKRPGAQKISLAFFTHRLEPEKAAGFVTKYGDLLLTEKVLLAQRPDFRPWREVVEVSYKRGRHRESFLEKTTCPVRRDLLTKQQVKVLALRESRAAGEDPEDAWRRCLLRKLRRWRKGTLHDRSCLTRNIPQEFFLHRLETSNDFLAKFGRALVASGEDSAASEPEKDVNDP
ncbi:ANKRD50 [Symbiodinium natans]|uniref:ANKRD50 protein n=1 Tax=Symbiodinium natans TaxID=878477 RepID=A0A812Q4A3_9DINO|nr:ANKRD50 [Symbiodinium natans]